jgi:uncharacterized protein (TIGR02145 family)
MISCKKDDGKGVPTITMAPVNNITETSATSGGEVTSDGGSQVTARGVCWSIIDENPTTGNRKTLDGGGTGSFTSSITELIAGTAYYIRAYAINASGTGYSSSSKFNALSSKPALTTASFTFITPNSVTSGGNITNDGGAAVTARGVCWNTTGNPTIVNSKTTDGAGSGTFSSLISGLVANTSYYFRAYATNSMGTSYGNEIPFKTYTGTVTDYDNNVYGTVTIGTQIWMVANLKTTKYNDGTSIPLVTNGASWIALSTPGYCWYNNDITNKETYGAMYNYYVVDPAINGGKNVCPVGWHVPTDDQWNSISLATGAADKLKESGTAHWISPNTGATNETGFTALPAGNRGSNGEFDGIGSSVSFWTSNEYEINSAWDRFISSSNSDVHRQYYGKRNGISIRCLKN